MLKLCGDEEDCEGLDLGNLTFDTLLDVKLCKENSEECYYSADAFKPKDIIDGKIKPRLLNRINIKEMKEKFYKILL